MMKKEKEDPQILRMTVTEWQSPDFPLTFIHPPFQALSPSNALSKTEPGIGLVQGREGY